MSFGAMAAWQALALIAVAGAAAAWIFLVKVRPPRVLVPTLLLWRRVFDRARELTLWERVRRAVSLAATVLIALALALAVTRPGPRRGPASEGRTLIILDSSWSMAARTSSGETRWQRAVRQARALAASAGGGDVALATTAEGLVEGPTSDMALIETAIDRLGPGGGDLSALPSVPGTDHVHFVTDGAVPRALDPSVTLHSVFEAAPNAAIIAFGARPSPGSATAEAYLQVANYAPASRQVRIVVSRGSSVLSDQKVEMAAGEAVSQVLPLAETGSARLVARIEADADGLTEDNEAVAWIESVDAVDVTVVSDNPAALVPLFEPDPSLKVSFVKPASYVPVTSGIVLFDRWLPAEPPARPALVVAPPAAGWLGKPGAEEKSARWLAAGTHPVVAGVDPLTVDLKRVRGYEGADLAIVAKSERGTPLVSVRDARDHRVVVWSFAPADSNLAMAPAFPVLFGDAIEWLARPSYGVQRQSGPVQLPASTSRVVSPDGKAVPLVRAGDRAVVRLVNPGLYLVEAGGSRGVVGVNVGDPDVSNLSRSSLKDAAASRVASGAAGWPWWMWAVALAFALVSVEWFTWQRRVTV